MLTAMHMLDSTAHASPSSPWLPLGRHLTAPSPSPSPSPSPRPPAVAAAALHRRRAAAAAAAAGGGRRIAKRRPRPSRRSPTTYITADPANFRRMVHQVTGADDLPAAAAVAALSPPELLRPTPTPAASASAGAGAGALMLPTLDTSAYLLGSTPPPLVGGGAGAYASNNIRSNCGFPTLDSWDLL
ncbi:hypothetical protein GUJ93_ZPchr0009g1931 [Zizania palustris]|uniref:VQ domain-containing protein n=1 Tax=Zizania palustris TaxID=103762 RepID=A0A8J5RKB3_ZIZPA|nr:hypothetical protein GUJ93_ZPchr0009g1931 [Zizania palustris]